MQEIFVFLNVCLDFWFSSVCGVITWNSLSFVMLSMLFACLNFQSMECILVDDPQLPVNGHTANLHMESDPNGCSALDDVLHKLDSGVEMSLHRAQAWSKFAKDLVGYIEKRTNLCMWIHNI